MKRQTCWLFSINWRAFLVGYYATIFSGINAFNKKTLDLNNFQIVLVKKEL